MPIEPITVTKLNSDIVASEFIDKWGGECINKTSGKLPVGVGISDGKENIFGYNDSHNVSAYMYTNNLTPDANGTFTKEIRINIFQKKSNTEMDSYQSAANLHFYLTRRKYDVTIGLDKTVKCEFCYFSYLTVKITMYPKCEPNE